MRYPYSSWSDVDRALEAYRYARRSLLVVVAAALPFAAWDAVSPGATTAAHEPDVVRTVEHVDPVLTVLPVRLVAPPVTCNGRADSTLVPDAAV